MLNRDEAARLRTDATVRRAALRLLPGVRDRMAGFISAVVGGWDARLITDKLELRVGRDLQYVRVNGTLVGALVGGLFYLALRAMFGAVES